MLGLSGKRIKTADIQNFETVSLDTEVQVYAVFDKDNNDITSQFRNVINDNDMVDRVKSASSCYGFYNKIFS